MNKTYFISGVSGVGKSSTINFLRLKLNADKYDIRDLDERGVPDGGGREWIKNETRFWLDTAKLNALNGKNTIICGFANPEVMNTVIKKDEDQPVQIILLHASAYILKKRLMTRHSSNESIKEIERASGVPLSKFIDNNVKFLTKFKEICDSYNCPVIDTDGKTPEKVADEIISIINT